MNSSYSRRQLSPKELAQERRLHNIRNWGAVLLCIVGVYLFDRRPEVVSFEMAILALAIMAVGLYPAWQYFSDRRRPPLPFMPLVGIFYVTSFGLPMFTGDAKSISRFSLKTVDDRALILVLIGVVLLNVSFYFSKYFIWHKLVPMRLANTYSNGKLLSVLWIFMAIRLGSIYVPAIRAIPSFSFVAGPLGLIAFGMFLILSKQQQLPRWQQTVAWCVCLPLVTVPMLASGSLAPVISFCLFMGVISFFQTKRLPIAIVTIALTIFIALNPIKGDFRRLTWGEGELVRLDPVQKIQLFLNLAIEKYTNPDAPKIDNQASAVNRTAHIFLFSQVVKDTPEKVPYWGGQTYLPVLTSFIPRAILPFKPEERVGNEFGRRYSYLGSSDETTSFNLPWIVEMYANFGEFGVFFGMTIVGYLLAMLEQKFNNPNMQPLEFVTGSTMLFSLAYQESNFSIMTGSIILVFMCLMLIFKFLIGSRRRKLPNS